MTTMPLLVEFLFLAFCAVGLPALARAQEPAGVCTCTCAFSHSDGSKIVVDTLVGAACSPCEESCCASLCAPILKQDLERRRAEKKKADKSPEPPEPSEDEQMRENVRAFLEFVMPQLKRGSGDIPTKAVTDAIRLDRIISPDTLLGIEARGSIVFSDGKGVNQGTELKSIVPMPHGLTMTVFWAADISADVAPAADGRGLSLSRVKGLSLKIPVLPALRVHGLSVFPDVIKAKLGLFWVTLWTDPNKTALRPKETP